MKEKLTNGRLIGFPALQFFTWATNGSLGPFIVVFLVHRGLDNTQIGIILMVNAMVSIGAQPLWGFISDWIRSIRKVYVLCLAVSALVSLALPNAKTTSELMVTFAFFMLFFSPLAPLLDNWTLQSVKNQEKKSYGAMRLWGSLGFAIIVAVMGRLVTIASVNIMCIIYAIMSVVTIAVSLAVGGNGAAGTAVKMPGITKLLKNYYYVSYICIACLMWISIQPMYGFLVKLILNVGGNDAFFGWTMSVNALCEIPVFLCSGYLINRFQPFRLIVASMFFYTVRLACYSLAVSPLAILLVTVLQGLSYSLFLIGTISYIDSMAPVGLKSTAQTLGSALFAGVSGMVGNYAGGRLIDQIGIQPAYRVGAYISIAVLVLFLLSLLVGKYITARRRHGEIILE